MEGFICHTEKLKLSFISSGEIFEVLERVMQSDVMIGNVSGWTSLLRLTYWALIL